MLFVGFVVAVYLAHNLRLLFRVFFELFVVEVASNDPDRIRTISKNICNLNNIFFIVNMNIGKILKYNEVYKIIQGIRQK